MNILETLGKLASESGFAGFLAAGGWKNLIMIANQKKAAAAAAVAQAPAPAPAPEPVKKPEAKGTAGELKLHDVEPRDAALIMAIVAHRLGKPVNELRFRSIKEVK